ncbi:MAG: cytochrome c biogenesis protein ResB, partial [Rhodoferax sp.]
STGMPKLFASDVVFRDNATGKTMAARIEVNHPVKFDGVEVYQSSFTDGGSHVTLQALPMSAATKPFEIEGVIGGSSQLTKGQGPGSDKLTLEYADLRVINVENFGAGSGDATGTDVRKVNLRSSIDSSLGAADNSSTVKALRNVGPSITYRLRDAAGQAREFQNYMLPVDMGDGVPIFLLGVRDTPEAPYRYLRIPADDRGSIEGFMRLRAALADPALREAAVQRYAALAVDSSKPELTQELATSAARALALFAGTDRISVSQGGQHGGLQALSDFIETNVPAAQRSRASEVLVRILNGTLFQLMQITRERAGLPALEPSEKTQAFMRQAVLSLSDAQFYP